MRRSRLGWAGLISVLLHAVILALLWEQEPARPPSASHPETEPLIVEVLTPPSEPPAPPPEPSDPKPPDPKPPPPAAPPRPPETSRPVPRVPAPSERPAPSAEKPTPEVAAPASPLRNGPPEDAPLVEEQKRPSLMPPTPSGGWSVPEVAIEKPRGRTLHPGDPSLSPEVLKAEELARVTERVQSFAEDDLATLRVENGLVHPYFSQIRTSLAKEMENAPLFDVEGTGKRIAQEYLRQAQSYGATGSTGRRGRGKGPIDREPPTALQKLESISQGNPAQDSMRAFLQAGEALQQLAQPAPDLVIVLELQQTPDGQLRSVQVVERSGNKAFDEYVLDAVPPALAKLTPPPSEALPRHPEVIRTLWAVEGRVIYLRRISELKGQDAWYIASAAGLGMLAGTFEETTGDIYVIDLRNPKFDCRPRLLKVW